MASEDALWPSVDAEYVDEFGSIDPTVDRIARELWPRAEYMARELLHDSAVGYRLLKRAVAVVSRVMADRPNEIAQPAGYIFQTYKRLVLSELEKMNGHRARELDEADVRESPGEVATRLDRHILVAELMSRMDPWTRKVFDALALGYSFNEIGRALGANPHVVRNRFRLSLRKLRDTVGRKTPEPSPSRAKARPQDARTAAHIGMMRIRLFSPSTIRRTDS